MRAVLDTNVILAGQKSSQQISPNREILQRWRRQEFILLFTDDILLEYIEKLLTHGIKHTDIVELIDSIRQMGELITIGFFHLHCPPADNDDMAFLLCAANGVATHLVSYDHHLTDLAAAYDHEFVICPPLVFLRQLRNT
jgi:predicted nucleic acid-binding protein